MTTAAGSMYADAAICGHFPRNARMSGTRFKIVSLCKVRRRRPTGYL
jgi:hypothetical protein